MTQHDDQQLASRMPSADQIAEEAIARLATRGYRSRVMQIDNAILWQLAKRLVTPGVVRADTFRWLAEQLTEVVDDNTFYRFCQHFEEAYKSVWAQYAANLVVANLDVSDEDVSRLAEFNRRRAMELIASELVTTQSPADLDTQRLATILKGLRQYDQTSGDRQDRAMRAELVQQQLEKSRLDAQLKQQRLDRIGERIREIERKIDNAQQLMAQGKGVQPSVFAAIRRELIAMAEEAPPEVPTDTADEKEVA